MTLRLKYIYLVLLALVLLPTRILSQNSFYNLNIENGLPSDHVYSTITDHLGYLWIATDNGVVKYNGYDFKVFTTQDGLPKNDVWQLLEDGKGRIWLGCIADRFGYIYNDKYCDAVFADTKRQTIYPARLSLLNGHIAFASSFHSDNLHPELFIERNDTIYRFEIARKLKKLEPSIKLEDHGPINVLNIFLNSQTKNATIYYEGKIYSAVEKNGVIDCQFCTRLKADNNPKPEIYNSSQVLLVHNHFFCRYYNSHRQKLMHINIATGNVDTFDLHKLLLNEPINYLYYNSSNISEDNIYVFSASHAIKICVEPAIRIIGDITGSLTIHNQFPQAINSYTTYPFWYNMLATPEHGLTIFNGEKEQFHKWNTIDLSGYRHIPSSPEEGIWIDNGTHLLKFGTDLKKIRLNGISRINYALKKDSSSYLLVGQKNFNLDTRKNVLQMLPDSMYSLSLFQAVKVTDEKWYCISNFDFYKINPKLGTADEQNIDIERYNEVIYDHQRNMLWVYNQNICLLYNLANDTKLKLSGKQLMRFGTGTLEKICVDEKFGNVFIYGNNKLTLYDYETNRATELSKDLYLDRCSIRLYKDVLAVYGIFGIQFYNIYGKGKLSAPVLYKNTKGVYYNYIKDIQLLNDTALFTTDKGTFQASIPILAINNGYRSASPATWRFAIINKDTSRLLNPGDTLLVDTKYPSIRFDAINPEGIGKVYYSLFDGTTTVQLQGSEYLIPSKFLTPDNYYKITLTAHDKAWKSKPLTVVIYTVPKWYQTKTMVKVIWATLILALLLLVTTSILITRRLVLNATKKRNLRMELELKSIYAQINPHFIFNSLNSALLLVSKNKTEEAYTHISKFSKLLRSYIKSSRNKLILLADEIKNLTNYIDLQQVRFKDKFNYSINATPDVAVDEIYIPSLLLQPFVENAIEHGLLGKEEKGNLAIHFRKSGNKLICIIEDDGVGRKESKLNKIPNPVKDESYGELLIKDLVNIFNRYEHMNIHIEYEDKTAPLTGTVVTIYINLEG
jgi:hypothetical protein